jgi:hypothetical protein
MGFGLAAAGARPAGAVAVCRADLLLTTLSNMETLFDRRSFQSPTIRRHRCIHLC